jgi:hypothetical protein
MRVAELNPSGLVPPEHRSIRFRHLVSLLVPFYRNPLTVGPTARRMGPFAMSLEAI